MSTRKTETTHKTGYHVWAHGERTWHRTLDGAERAAAAASAWASDVQIIDVATGDRV